MAFVALLATVNAVNNSDILQINNTWAPDGGAHKSEVTLRLGELFITVDANDLKTAVNAVVRA